MDIFGANSYLIYLVVIAAVLHASLQMPLATLLHMAGHSLGRGTHMKQALLLGLSFSLGVFLTVAGLLVVSFIAILFIPENWRYILPGLAAVVSGVVIMLSYFRGSDGSRLWLSRRYIHWFHHYIERRHNYLSAFSLGNLSIILELVFSLPLLLSLAVLLSRSSSVVLWESFILYGLIVALPLIFASFSLSGGNNLLRLQTWREESRQFWQFFVGVGFILFGLYIASGPIIYNGVL